MSPSAIRELRDLTRYRVNLAEECNRIANRVQTVLEDANIKLASVATDTLGASGRAMLKAMIAGEENAEVLAELSKGLLRKKMTELRGALEGRIMVHHRVLLQELTDHLEFVEGKMLRLEEEIAKRMHPFDDAIRGLRQIPGVDRIKRRACSLCDSCAPRVASRPHKWRCTANKSWFFEPQANHENKLLDASACLRARTASWCMPCGLSRPSIESCLSRSVRSPK